MVRRVIALIAVLLAVAPPVAAQSARTNGWGVALTDVPPDPTITYGTLPNGMKYAIRRNAFPKGSASVRLRFAFGSIGEDEDERGLAHFIEHMAFNGSTNVAEGEMVKILERQGLKFGPDNNAQTGFDQTLYLLDLPKAADDAQIDTALMLMREVASEIAFDPGAVDRERGVILGERRVRNTFQLSQVMDQFAFQIPETPYPQRLPIGTEAVLKTAPAERLKALYRRYYRPENATLVFVGDADPKLIERKIREKFASWKAPAEQPATLPRGTVDLKRGAAFDIFIHPSVATTVSLTAYRPWRQPPDTLAERRIATVRGLARTAFNRRLLRLVTTPDSPLLSASLIDNDIEAAALGTSFGLVAKDGAWKEALALGEQELRRAIEHGFTTAELDLQKAENSGFLKNAVEQADARTHQALASAILNVVDKGNFVTTPAFRQSYWQSIAPTVTVAEVNAAFRELWSGSAPLVHVSTKDRITVAEVAEAYRASVRLAVAAPPAAAAIAFAYSDFGPAGAIVEDRRIADLGIRAIRFANGVRLNIKPTDFETGKIAFSARLGGGMLALPMNRPGMSAMLSSLAIIGATAKHSLDDIRTYSAGQRVIPGWSVQADALLAAGTVSADDLALQMKLSAAYLTDPGFRPEAASQWANMVPVISKQIDANPASVLSSRAAAMLASGDWRFGIPPAAMLAETRLDEARPVVGALAASAPIEIGLVGDVDEAAAIRAVAESFGALPRRAAAAVEAPGARQATFRSDKSPILLQHTGNRDQEMVALAWPTNDDSDFTEELGMTLLASVMDLMLTESVRENLGASYGVSTGSVMSEVFDGYGFLTVSSLVDPEQADKVEGEFRKVAQSLRDAPVSADLFNRARAPMLESVAKAKRRNAYWLGFVAVAQSKADRLDRARRGEQLLAAVTPADIQALARKYLAGDRAQRVRIVSDKAVPAKPAAAN